MMKCHSWNRSRSIRSYLGRATTTAHAACRSGRVGRIAPLTSAHTRPVEVLPPQTQYIRGPSRKHMLEHGLGVHNGLATGQRACGNHPMNSQRTGRCVFIGRPHAEPRFHARRLHPKVNRTSNAVALVRLPRCGVGISESIALIGGYLPHAFASFGPHCH